MRVFITGATGFIGSALIPKLLEAGHQVLGMTRSDAGAEKLRAAGVEVHRGQLEDLDSMRDGASKADAVVHLAFDHDNFEQFEKVCELDYNAIRAMGEVLVGSKRPMVVTSGTAMAANVDGKPSTEDAPIMTWNPRSRSELAIQELISRGANISIVRLPQVHDPRRQGLVPYVTAIAKQKGVSAYIGDGSNRWPAAHVSDVALLYRLALERAEPGSIYHAVDEEGVSMKEIAETLAEGLQVPVKSLTPEEAEAHFGWLNMFARMDMPSSSAKTQQILNWHPSGPSLIADLKAMDYSQV